MYDKQFISSLVDKIVISDVIGRSVRLINKGRDKVACCPFHKEKTPSFHVNDEKGFYHCFGCGAHGNVITFVMQQDGLSFKETIEHLAEDYGIEIKKTDVIKTKNQKDIINETEIILNINEKACQFFQDCIFSTSGKVGLNYIMKRGLNIDNIKKFRVGFAPQNNQLMEFLKKNNFTEKQIENAGLIVQGENGYYDKFRSRVMFPVLDKKGKVIAFTGRVINKDKMPKYMNSPETLVYHKSNVLFNYFFARKSIYDNKNVILVEGNLDAIGLSINGIENVVAPMGTAITLRQIEDLWVATDEIIVCLDGDSAGCKASKRLALLVLPILTATKNIKFVFLPENQDPDDFVKNYGKTGFLNFINDKKNYSNLSEFLWNSELNDLNIEGNNYITPEQKSKLETNLKNLINQIKNPLVSKNFEDFYKKQLFLITRYENSKKVANYRDTTKINYKKVTSPLNSIENLKDSIKKIEKNIFYLLINNLQFIDMIFQQYNIDIFGINYFVDDATNIIDILLNIYETDKINDKEILNKILEKNGFNDYIKNNDYYNNISDEKKLKYLYSLILERNILVLEIEVKELSIKNNNENRRQTIFKELENLYKKKNDLESEF